MSGFEIRGIQNVSFVDLKTGEKINIDNASVAIKNEGRDCNNSQLNCKNINLKDKTFVYELAYVNKKKLYEVLYGTTNNYRRLHDGYALREVTRRRYIMKHRRQVKKKER